MLDEALSQALHAIRLMERALHDRSPMFARFGDLEVPVRRASSEGELALLADFPAHCHLVRPESIIYLICEGEIIGAREIEDPGDGPFEVEWKFSLAAHVEV